MVNKLEQILAVSTPALASAAVAGAAWWSQHGNDVLRAGRAAASSVGRVVIRRWIPVALAALISVTIGALVYSGHAVEVSGARALHGALLALLASAIALGVYWILGIVVRRLVTLAGLWVLGLMPLYFYALFAWLVVAGYAQCGPQAYECPV
jgi:hypothetical protein